jgi:hypothetical protein
MPLPRMTIRRWMVAVAVVALAPGAVAMSRRSFHLRLLAILHDIEATQIRISRGWATGPDGVSRLIPLDDPKLVRLAEYHEALSRKYERAANFPWLPVEPDPPEPR